MFFKLFVFLCVLLYVSKGNIFKKFYLNQKNKNKLIIIIYILVTDCTITNESKILKTISKRSLDNEERLKIFYKKVDNVKNLNDLKSVLIDVYNSCIELIKIFTDKNSIKVNENKEITNEQQQIIDYLNNLKNTSSEWLGPFIIDILKKSVNLLERFD